MKNSTQYRVKTPDGRVECFTTKKEVEDLIQKDSKGSKELAKQYIDLLAETPEYKKLRGDFERLQEEKRKFHEKEEEMAYNLFWKGEAPSYDEYKKAMAQIQDMDAREKQIIQEFYEFPYSARLPSSFVNSLELVVEAK